MKASWLILIFLFLISFSLSGQNEEKRSYPTQKIPDDIKSPVVNGSFDEPAWDLVPWQDNFIQHDPYNGQVPSQITAFKLLYDDNNIFLAIKASDTAPDSIETRLTRRDNPDGDIVGISIDSYFDKLTAFTFLVNAGGVKSDMLLTDDGENEDINWDPVWFVKTLVNEDGWNAEMKIPLSQLRFNRDSTQVWGMELVRILYRKQETSFWQAIPKDAPGMVHLFGELQGIRDIKPKRQIELAPYGVGSFETNKQEVGNPFRDGKDWNYKLGLDGKIGITNNTILDFTVNPDFGQVEADPSQVNLTAYETYFEEKRPFFIEGKNLFDFSLLPGAGDLSNENLFYSRRIGRRPHGTPDLGNNEYARIHDFTSILGAAKVTSKNANGLSIGILDAITPEVKAEIDHNGTRRFATTEPFTNYFTGRLQKDFGKGKTILGGMITSTNRNINDSSLNFLHNSALTGGINFTHTWQNKNYYFTLNTIFSEVEGSEEALLRTQESSARYYQRPDAKHLSLDSTRKSLWGYGGRMGIGKQGGGNFTYGAIVTWKSPGLELNDIGFLRSTDEILAIFHGGYNLLDPFGIFRGLNINLAAWHGWDFSGENLLTGANLNIGMQFTNYWNLFGGVSSSTESISKSTLRGGPMFINPGSIRSQIGVSSDERKKLIIGLNTGISKGFEKSATGENFGLEINYRPSDMLRFSLKPGISHNRQELQYITTTSFNTIDRYLFGSINQKIVSLDFRMNLSITPNLTIQYWGQPFIATADYFDFKRITDPRAPLFADRFRVFGTNEIIYDDLSNVYSIDENQDSNIDYAFENPDFNYKTFLSNLVVRWEYTPGSTFYFVWSQSREGVDPNGKLILNENFSNIFTIFPQNVFLIKFSYRFRV